MKAVRSFYLKYNVLVPYFFNRKKIHKEIVALSEEFHKPECFVAYGSNLLVYQFQNKQNSPSHQMRFLVSKWRR